MEQVLFGAVIVFWIALGWSLLRWLVTGEMPDLLKNLG